MMVESDGGKFGKIQSVSGWRVMVDFNYELAGKALEYEVNVEEKINKTEEKMRLLLEYHFPYADPNAHEVKRSDNKATITLAEVVKLRNDAVLGKHAAAADIFKFIEGVEEIEFLEVFKKPKEEKPKEENPQEEKKEADTPAKEPSSALPK